MTDSMGTITNIHSRYGALSEQAAAKDARLRQTCADFESIFIQYILKSGRNAFSQNGIFNNSHESKIYKSMLDEQMARCAARGRGMGLGQLLYEQLKKDGS